MLVAMMALSAVLPVQAYSYDDWAEEVGYGSFEGVDANITKIKGEANAVNGMFQGPFSKASTQKLAEGINEKINIELNPSAYAHGEFFELSVALKDAAGDYVTEAVVMTQKTGDSFNITAAWAPNFKVVISNEGVYTYQYKMFIKNDQSYVNFSVLLWDEVVASTGDVDLDSAALTTADTKNPVKDNAVDVKYTWFANVKVQNGVMVYDKLPPKPVVDEPTTDDEKPTDNDDYVVPNTSCR